MASGTHPRSVTRVTRQLRTDVSCSHRARASGEGDPAKIWKKGFVLVGQVKGASRGMSFGTRTDRLWSVDSDILVVVVITRCRSVRDRMQEEIQALSIELVVGRSSLFRSDSVSRKVEEKRIFCFYLIQKQK